MRICSIPGCGKKHAAKNYCFEHYCLLTRGHVNRHPCATPGCEHKACKWDICVSCRQALKNMKRQALRKKRRSIRGWVEPGTAASLLHVTRERLRQLKAADRIKILYPKGYAIPLYSLRSIDAYLNRDSSGRRH